MPYLSFLILAFALLSSEGARASHPAAASAGVLTFDVFSDGEQIHLLTAETGSEEAAHLFHRVSHDGGESWSEARQVDASMPPPFSPRPGFDPQIAARGPELVAAWTIAGTDQWGSGPIATAFSKDGGLTWQAGPNPADDALTTGHGFIDLAVDSTGAFQIVWLDSRDGKQGLRQAQSTDGGISWSKNHTLKAVTCECCRNTLATGPNGEVAALFRDHDPRDMGLVLRKEGTWMDPLIAGQFDWKFEGCPHAGGGLAILGSGVHALVWTGSEAHRGVHHVRLGEQPQRLGGPYANYPDLAANANGHLLAVWQERGEEGTVLHQTLSSDEGRAWNNPQVIRDAAPSATHPRVVAIPAGFLVFWLEMPEDAPSRWGLARIAAP